MDDKRSLCAEMIRSRRKQARVAESKLTFFSEIKSEIWRYFYYTNK